MYLGFQLNIIKKDEIIYANQLYFDMPKVSYHLLIRN